MNTPFISNEYVETVTAKGVVSQLNHVSKSEEDFWKRAARNKKLATWFSSLADSSEESYLKLLLDEDFAKVESHKAEEWILHKIKNDLMGYGIFLTEDQIKSLAA